MSTRLLLWLLCSIVLTSVADGQDFDQLLKKVPDSANALVLIDVERTLASELATKEGWGHKLELAYVNRPVFLPPEASKLVIAGALQPTANFARLWELGVAYGVDTAGMGGGGYANYEVSYGYDGRVLGDLYSGARTSAADRSAMKASAMADAIYARVEGFAAIDVALASIRQKMTAKYQVEF